MSTILSLDKHYATTRKLKFAIQPWSNKTDSKQVSWIKNTGALEQILSGSRRMRRRTELGQNIVLLV